jgi:hypothetical protein
VHTPGRTRQAANCDTSVAADIAGDPFRWAERARKAFAEVRDGPINDEWERRWIELGQAEFRAACREIALDARGDRPC